MNFKIIKKYFDLIHKSIANSDYFFNVNRYHKASVGYPIELSKYPYDGKWNVVSSKSSWKQEHIHQLITQRQTKKGNIKEELIKIDKIYKKIKALDKTNLSSRIYQRLKDIVNQYRYQ